MTKQNRKESTAGRKAASDCVHPKVDGDSPSSISLKKSDTKRLRTMTMVYSLIYDKSISMGALVSDVIEAGLRVKYPEVFIMYKKLQGIPKDDKEKREEDR